MMKSRQAYHFFGSIVQFESDLYVKGTMCGQLLRLFVCLLNFIHIFIVAKPSNAGVDHTPVQVLQCVDDNATFHLLHVLRSARACYMSSKC